MFTLLKSSLVRELQVLLGLQTYQSANHLCKDYKLFKVQTFVKDCKTLSKLNAN